MIANCIIYCRIKMFMAGEDRLQKIVLRRIGSKRSDLDFKHSRAFIRWIHAVGTKFSLQTRNQSRAWMDIHDLWCEVRKLHTTACYEASQYEAMQISYTDKPWLTLKKNRHSMWTLTLGSSRRRKQFHSPCRKSCYRRFHTEASVREEKRLEWISCMTAAWKGFESVFSASADLTHISETPLGQLTRSFPHLWPSSRSHSSTWCEGWLSTGVGCQKSSKSGQNRLLEFNTIVQAEHETHLCIREPWKAWIPYNQTAMPLVIVGARLLSFRICPLWKI